ncbi:hypothetical protein CYY_002413 [Polysphondylium violaceum]|uniref:Membrane insertase YidC/Oxa/ALB C-terminal domain-containing protein n=1 Tax=Polysphondylium violaceum TaxID=133409 RepID=A0A8J4PY51_9MYCE|nr:hypothetical protein CYY_002413 [Polysphondylium violaceum]
MISSRLNHFIRSTTINSSALSFSSLKYKSTITSTTSAASIFNNLNSKRCYSTVNDNNNNNSNNSNNNDIFSNNLQQQQEGLGIHSINYQDLAKNVDMDPTMIEITGLPTFIEVVLNNLHQWSGVSWMVIVPLFTLGIRTALFPLTIKQRKNAAALIEIKPQLDKFKEISKANRASGKSNLENATNITDLLASKKCHPLLSYVLPLANLPFFISSVIAFREMSTTFPSFKDAGMLWFTDLSASDSYFILPVTCSALYLIINELSIGKVGHLLYKALSWVARIMALAIIPLSPTIPSMVYFYWIPSALFTIAQLLVLKNDRFCKMVGVPKAVWGDAAFQNAPPPVLKQAPPKLQPHINLNKKK